ncbi:histidine kinase [Dactylosporangium salmoneum]
MVAQERIRLARELLDVVAHSVSAITVQAGYAHLVIDEHPQPARAALATIETLGRDTMAELCRLLSVLRADDGPGLTPAPGLADLNRLVTSSGRAGVRVDLAIEGEPRRLPPGIDLAAYRVLQEALTNVARHAAVDTASVRVAYRPEALLLDVVDHGRGPARHRRAGADRDAGTGRPPSIALDRVEDVAGGIAFPHAEQAVRITRTRITAGRTSRETAYLTVSLPTADAQPSDLQHWIRRYWHIENRLHHVRDVTFREDQHQARTGTGPAVIATLRNTAIGYHRTSNATNIARATRRANRRSHDLIDAVTSAYPTTQ